jgi:hypothetical protein
VGENEKLTSYLWANKLVFSIFIYSASFQLVPHLALSSNTSAVSGFANHRTSTVNELISATPAITQFCNQDIRTQHNFKE